MLNVNSLTAKPPVGRSEYGRVKVALSPGKGLMDWVRLSTSKILAKKRLSSVDHNELQKHNTEADCWIHLFGQVYDVTSYLDFHPGGVPELMRAAGRDATPLFNQYHAWVNYESMLKSCLVGRFTGDLAKLPPCGPPTVDETVNTSRKLSNGFVIPQASSGDSLGLDVDIDAYSIHISSADWSSLLPENVVYSFDEKLARLRILVRHFGMPATEIVWESVPDDVLLSKISLETEKSSLRLSFSQLGVDLSESLADCKRVIRKRPVAKYHECVITELRFVSHDTLLFNLETPIGLHLPIPLGQHVSLKIKQGMTVRYRPYTPVAHTLPEEEKNGSVQLMIKIYEKGSCTRNLKNIRIGDKLEISDPIGDKDVADWIDDSKLLMLAAGTGLTPMLPIISWRLEQPENRTELVLFNKTEQDIVEDDWTPVRWNDERIHVRHVLSSPSSSWEGLSGRISATHLPPLNDSYRVLLCGPDGFIESAMRVLGESNFPVCNTYIFQG